ncbi:response regulator transcription factor [Cohnella zeiphila]|uniref:Response regulator n=1 Tax=Cohnella zeiphila TaxID=2761120 RepID=A0A7X0SIZ3_9BACL|nr:response regulator [Cohnella zeiphila]MBB6730766.1 response regulator [Cohnella zeiphila]
MFTLLIVDDEPMIADGLYEEFQDSREWDLDVYRAYSGKEALERIEHMKVDILISDIRMPGVDGIELLKQVRSRWPSCRVILLSGYKEFDYAYSALEYGAVRYVLKTEGYDKVIDTVKQAAADLEQSRLAAKPVPEADREPDARSGTPVREMLREDRQDRRTADIIAKLKDYIENHLHRDISLVALADVVHFNPSYLSRYFKQQTGLNLSEFVQSVKVERAKRMLADPDIRVNDIAEALGYGSASNFTRLFKRLTGSTPQEFRETAIR